MFRSTICGFLLLPFVTIVSFTQIFDRKVAHENRDLNTGGFIKFPGTSSYPVFGLSKMLVTANNTVFIIGFDSKIDGDISHPYGIIWTFKPTSSQPSIAKIQFVGNISDAFFLDDLTGWIIASGEKAYRTNNGGETWRIFEQDKETIRSIYFIDKSTGWYIDENSSLIFVADETTKKLAHFGGSPYFKRIQFTSRHVGWLNLVAYDSGSPQSLLVKTEDGGDSWNEQFTENDSIFGFQFIDDITGFALGAEGLYRTDDGGKQWRMVKKQETDKGFYKLFFLDRKIGWTFGKRICTTIDGGETWKCSSLPENIRANYIKDAVFQNRHDGWILTEKGLYVTKNGGADWERKWLLFEGRRF